MNRFIFILLLSWTITIVFAYQIGTGISDITGPSAQIMLMGYAVLGQTGEGILQRLWSRAYIIVDDETNNRVVFVNTDTQSMGDIIKKRVVNALQEIYGPDLYTVHNVMISSTHSHSGMGGYLQYSKVKENDVIDSVLNLTLFYSAMYEIAALGWIEETAKPLTEGIVQSIIIAHNNLQEGSLSIIQGELLNTNINRSPQSYLLNPEEERANYKYDVDKTMTVISFTNKENQGLGLISW